MEKFNVVVIGAGAGGLVSSYLCASLKSKVALIEKHKMGGDCLNYGCVPSKALIKTAKFVSEMKRHQELGIKSVQYEIDFAQVMDRVHEKIAKIEPHDSVERYEGLGVRCFSGEAEIVDHNTVKVGDKTLHGKSIILAMGASPFVPPIKGLDAIKYRTSENLWSMRELPKRLVVLGGGPIGCELAQSFQRLGSQVTQVEMLPSILAREDQDVSQVISESLKKDGVDLLTGHKAKEVLVDGDEKVLICEGDGGERRVPFDEIIVAVGRRANTSGFDWDRLGVELNPNGTIKVDPYLRAGPKNFYACGDVAGPYQFTHTAAHQAYYCAVNALFSPWVKFKANYDVISWCTFTDPEVAQVGLNEKAANELGIPYEVTTYGMDDSDRAITESEAHGFIKVLTKPGSDKILGATVISHLAGELIGEFVSAMRMGFGLNKILGTIHAYPTFIEGNKAVAGNWKKNHSPGWALKILAWLHPKRI